MNRCGPWGDLGKAKSMAPASVSRDGNCAGRRPARDRQCSARRIAGRVQGRADLLEQFFARVGVGNETAQTLREHVAQFALLGEAAAENDGDLRIQGAQFIEDGVAIHDGEEEIEDHEAYLLRNLLVDFEGFETVTR